MGAYERLMAAARDPGDVATLAFGGVLARFRVLGLSADDLRGLADGYFPDAHAEVMRCFEPADGDGDCPAFRRDEFEDVVALLLEHRNDTAAATRWLACAVATACLGDNHLWQDMGLPDRDTLSALLRRYFTRLYAKNTGNMKWKKFFYKQLCERAEVNLCKAPSCRECTDYDRCFVSAGGETAP